MREDLKVGGNYTAVDNGDGTYNILDVPIFASIPAGTKRNKQSIGREWQEAALLKSRERAKSGHLPPVHIYHSDEEVVKPIHAGKLRLKEVRQTEYEGDMVWATFADILAIPQDVFTKIQKGFLPYRSVEIHNWDKPEIDSLALMDTDVPFFRMAMLTIGRVLNKDAEMFLNGRNPAQACRTEKKGAPSMAILFKFKDKKEDADTDDDGVPDEKDPALNAPPKADKGTEEEQDEPEVMEDDPKDKGPENAGPPGKEGVPTSPSPEGARPPENDQGNVLSALQMLQAQVQQIAKRLGPLPPPNEKLEAVNGMNIVEEAQVGAGFKDKAAEEDSMADPKDQKDKMTADSGAVTFKSKEEFQSFVNETVNKAVMQATTPLQAELSAFKATSEKQAKELAIKERFRAAKEELEKERFTVDENLERHLMKCAELGDEMLKDAVTTFKSKLPKEAPADSESFERELAGQADDESGAEGGVVAAFCAKHGKGNGKLQKWAERQVAEFRAYQSTSGTDMTLEDWLTTNFRAENMHVVNKV